MQNTIRTLLFGLILCTSHSIKSNIAEDLQNYDLNPKEILKEILVQANNRRNNQKSANESLKHHISYVVDHIIKTHMDRHLPYTLYTPNPCIGDVIFKMVMPDCRSVVQPFLEDIKQALDNVQFDVRTYRSILLKSRISFDINKTMQIIIQELIKINPNKYNCLA